MVRTQLTSASAVGEWLQTHARGDFGLSAPYARRWYNGGCSPQHPLFSHQDDPLGIFCEGLVGLGVDVYGIDDGVLLDCAHTPVAVAVTKYLPEEGPPSDYGVFINERMRGDLVSNSPLVIVGFLRALEAPARPPADDSRVQIGFPGQPSSEVTYVGSWQWNVHCEARGPEFCTRAAQAIAATIAAAENVL